MSPAGTRPARPRGRTTGRARRRGYVLVEVLVSMLIFALGILGLISIQAQSVKAGQDAKFRSDAVFAANELLGRMWVDRGNLASYAGDTTLTSLPAGNANVAINGAVVTVTVTWQPPGVSATHQYVTVATLVGN